MHPAAFCVLSTNTHQPPTHTSSQTPEDLILIKWPLNGQPPKVFRLSLAILAPSVCHPGHHRSSSAQVACSAAKGWTLIHLKPWRPHRLREIHLLIPSKMTWASTCRWTPKKMTKPAALGCAATFVKKKNTQFEQPCSLPQSVQMTVSHTATSMCKKKESLPAKDICYSELYCYVPETD